VRGSRGQRPPAANVEGGGAQRRAAVAGGEVTP
jgi:hypothetical protein